MEDNIDVDELLQQGIQIMINQWPALKLAIQNGWGQQRTKINPNQKETDDEMKEKLIISLTNYILNFDVTQKQVEDFLLDYMEDYFFTILDDNSEKYLAKMSLDLFNDLEINRSTYKLDQIKELSKQFEKSEVIGVNQQPDSEESGDEESDEEAPNLEEKQQNQQPQFQQSQQDIDDGFIVVKPKNQKK